VLRRSRSVLAEVKPLRATEEHWRSQHINVRSTLWNGPRPGAPFTSACLQLLAATQLPCWPWYSAGVPLLVEAFSAAQLAAWNLPNSDYNDDLRVRKTIIAGLSSRVEIPEPLVEHAMLSPDALDAIICAFAAVAVDQDRVRVAPEDPGDEGWIAVHE
jgi:hypothetical protein